MKYYIDDPMKIDYQLFAEGEDPADHGEQEEQAGNADPEQDEQGEKDDESGKKPGKQNARSVPKYSDNDLDRIIGDRFERWQSQQQAKIDEAKRLAEMDAQEKAEYEKGQLQKELDSLKREAAVSRMTKAARDILRDKGVNVPDELLSSLIGEDADSTKSKVDSFVDMFNESVERAVKAKLSGNAPRKSDSSKKTITKEEIMAVKNTAERQRLIAENIELFERK